MSNPLPTYPELADRAVVVTGAAQGIGAVTARAFAAQGSRLALLDIDEAGAAKVQREIAQAGGRAFAARCDVTDEKSVNEAIARVISELGALHVLINCAGGYGRLATVEDMTVEEWDSTVTLNLRSVFLCCRAAIPHLKRANGGRIINVASVAGRTVTSSSSPAYGSSKAAVIQLTRFLAHTLGPSNITANAIAPITTLTPRVAALRTEEEIGRIAAQIPLRRLPDPEDHALGMLFLASTGGANISGMVLDVNGGRVMM